MADQKISELTEKTTVGDTDLIPMVDESGTPTTKKITGANLKTAMSQQSRARAYLAGSQTVSNNTATKVLLDTENYDNLNEFDKDTNHRFVASTAGYYVVGASGPWVNTVDGELLVTYIYKNGAAVTECDAYASGTQGGGPFLLDIIYLDVNDYLELWVYQDSGDTRTILAGSTHTFMAVHRIS